MFTGSVPATLPPISTLSLRFCAISLVFHCMGRHLFWGTYVCKGSTYCTHYTNLSCVTINTNRLICCRYICTGSKCCSSIQPPNKIPQNGYFGRSIVGRFASRTCYGLGQVAGGRDGSRSNSASGQRRRRHSPSNRIPMVPSSGRNISRWRFMTPRKAS